MRACVASYKKRDCKTGSVVDTISSTTRSYIRNKATVPLASRFDLTTVAVICRSGSSSSAAAAALAAVPAVFRRNHTRVDGMPTHETPSAGLHSESPLLFDVKLVVITDTANSSAIRSKIRPAENASKYMVGPIRDVGQLSAVWTPAVRHERTGSSALQYGGHVKHAEQS